jgi:hypothetical protein
MVPGLPALAAMKAALAAALNESSARTAQGAITSNANSQGLYRIPLLTRPRSLRHLPLFQGDGQYRYGFE